MKYIDMKKNSDVNDFLRRLNVINYTKEIFDLSLYPDWDSTEYDKDNSKDYVFFNTEYFKNKYDTVIKCHLEDYGFWSDDKEDNELFNVEGEELIKDIGDSSSNHKINTLVVKGINNFEKEINFYGAFHGDSFTMDLGGLTSFKPIAECYLLYVPKNIKSRKFYYQLLAESRLLLEEDKVKLAFFTAFSAFDLYITYWEEYHNLIKYADDENVLNRRLEERLKDIYKNALSIDNIGKNIIWSSLMNEYNYLTDKRNDIAHGRDSEIIYEDYKNLIALISTFILTMECSCETFEDVELSDIEIG